jgi:hypothetical protein
MARDDNFTALLDELEEASFHRRLGEMRKATSADWVAEFWREHRAAPQPDPALGKLNADVAQMAKAQTVHAASRPETRRQHIERARSLVMGAVAAGNLTALQASRAEAQLHRLAQAIL